MTTYYVRTGGNDATGDGSTGNPWASIKKAIATVSDGGHTILVGNGTYAENDGGSLSIKRVLTSYLTIAPELGSSGAVTITTTSGTIPTFISAAAAYYKFQYLTFTTIAGANSAFRINNAADHIAFENCTFTPVDGAIGTIYCVDGSTWNVSAVSFTNCILNKPAVGASHAALQLTFSSTGVCTGMAFVGCTINGVFQIASLSNADFISFTNCVMDAATDIGIIAASSPDTVTLTNCTVSAEKSCIFCNGGTNWVVTGGTYTTRGAFATLTFGKDDFTGGLTTRATLTDVQVIHSTSVVGHAIMMGDGCDTCVLDRVAVRQAYDYAMVIKENTNIEIKNCDLTSGTLGALYFKAAVSANAHHNLLRTGLAGVGFRMAAGDSGNKCQNWTLANNTILATPGGSAQAYVIGGNTDDLGGGVVDYNVYAVNGVYGNVRGTTPIATLAALRAAWAGYGTGLNDLHSVDYMNPVIGMGRTVNRWTRVYMGGYDFSGYANRVGPMAVKFTGADATCLADAVKGFLASGVEANVGEVNGILDNDTAGLRVAAQAANLSWPMTVAVGIQQAPAAGHPVFAGYFRQAGYQASGDVGGIVAVNLAFTGWDATQQQAYNRFWGRLVHALAAETAVNSGTGVDWSASSSAGGFMAWHLISSNGTVTLTLQDSDDNATGWANVSGLTSGSQDATTTPVGGLAYAATNATIKQFTRWQLAFGTATTATFVLSLIRG